ncbi:MAG: ketoacyl-ACP synthase III [Bifidobacteriaceae bacterium]|jgi:3-oxoacyl-[acyl-carrier-protein] synthase-3|nr:ketoacyl-ACP synthase III [Bifidobacteriaceae bacterium]
MSAAGAKRPAPILREPDPRSGSRIAAVGGARGERLVTNEELAGPINSSDEWIKSRTGITTRARATADQSMLDLAEAAARQAIGRAGLAPAQVDAVILGSVTHFVQTPAAAPQLAARLGAVGAAAFDVSAACAGYCYGIGLADGLVRAGAAANVLVVGADKLSDMVDPTDRTISFLLGDGAGAAVVTASDRPRIGPTVWGSDGSKADRVGQNLDFREAVASGIWPTLRQDGPVVYKWAVFEMAKVALAAIAAAGLAPDDIEVFIPHQANLRIIEQQVKRIGFGPDVVVARDIAETGNTSAASIPLATERLGRDDPAVGGRLALQIGFGAGLAYAAQVVELPPAAGLQDIPQDNQEDTNERNARGTGQD